MLIAVLAALAAGCMFAVGSVLQQSQAREEPAAEALSWRLLLGLVRRPKWLLGISSDAASFGLQALALAFGPLALVQPLLVSGVLFAIPLAVGLRGRRLHLREWVATVGVAGGLALFLVVASPSAGDPQTSLVDWLAVIGGVAVLMLLGVTLGRARTGPARASFYALGAGAAFGLLAALTKTSTWLLSQGAVAFFTAWQPYAMAVVAVVGAVVQQSAFQAAPLPASVPVMDTLEPVVAVLIGVFAFGERVSMSPLALAGEVTGMLLLVGSVLALDRSPVVLSMQHEGDATQPGTPRREAGAGQDASRTRISST
jgi:drug/metabolite transporter (DMT)-like permease